MTFYIQMRNYCTHTSSIFQLEYCLIADIICEMILEAMKKYFSKTQSEGGSHPIYRKMLHTLHTHLRPVLRTGIAKSPIRNAYNIEISN